MLRSLTRAARPAAIALARSSPVVGLSFSCLEWERMNPSSRSQSWTSVFILTRPAQAPTQSQNKNTYNGVIAPSGTTDQSRTQQARHNQLQLQLDCTPTPLAINTQHSSPVLVFAIFAEIGSTNTRQQQPKINHKT